MNQPTLTKTQYDEQIALCADLFKRKNQDYGTAWRVLRPTSLTDQIYIKAQRIRSIEEKGAQKVADGIEGEYIGIINYCFMALIQLQLQGSEPIATTEIIRLYEQQSAITRQLMLDKNHDYGEAWRDMRLTSLTDLILMKLLRVKQIEDLQGAVVVSEGIDANYRDIANYAVFALIKIKTEAK